MPRVSLSASVPKPVEKKINLVLDSGAFSAWKAGTTIDIDAYIAYIKANSHLIEWYVNLDVIPGIPGRTRTQDEVEASAKKSYENLQYIKSHGLDPVPVFHQGERFYWLDRLIEDGQDYVGISPMADLPGPVVRRWMDQVFTRITTEDGRPIIRTHGFGVTNVELLFRYPWTTCDSTSWAMTANYGGIFVPNFKGGKPDFTRPPLVVAITEEQKNNPRSFDAFPAMFKDTIVKYLEQEVGVTLVEVKNDQLARYKTTIHFLLNVEKHLQDVRFKHRTVGMFE